MEGKKFNLSLFFSPLNPSNIDFNHSINSSGEGSFDSLRESHLIRSVFVVVLFFFF